MRNTEDNTKPAAQVSNSAKPTRPQSLQPPSAPSRKTIELTSLYQLSAAEVFDPVANTISPTANLIAARSEHTTTLLSTGQALVTGGLDSNSNYLATAELYH